MLIVDGSNLVTGGRNHPTMTIQALAFRAADHLIRAAKTGNLTRLRGAIIDGYTSSQKGRPMTLATVAQVKNQLSRYLARARQTREPIIVTHHGKPYALIQAISERDLETLDWKRLAAERLRAAWEGEDDALYDYL
jgi:prevent-host-death family protein